MKNFIKYTLIVAATFFVTTMGLIAINAENQPELRPWHYMSFSKDNLTAGQFSSFPEYLQAEKRYIDNIYDTLAKESKEKFSKYTKGDISSPIINGQNLNQSFLFKPKGKNFRGGALLVHGLSDSPYHVRKIGEFLADSGYYVIGIRLPGHGTIPAGLVDIHWQDWYQAVEFAAKFVREKIKKEGQGQFIMGGFSTGGTLNIHYVLDHILQEKDDLPDKLLFFSPAFGITPFAEVTDWHEMISWIPLFYKLKWQEIKPEYDPFRYNSWPFNAGYQIYSLANANWDLIDKLSSKKEYLKKIPPMITFQSRVDATVLPKKTYALYNEIAPDNSKLILFDINRELAPVIKSGILIWNIESIQGERVKRMTHIIPDASLSDTLVNRWPKSIYAISHIAVPISPNDKIYGKGSILGGLNIKGENGVLSTNLNMGRLKYNPFFDYMKRECLKFIAN
jgi:alpha-beta hydrolase superfamily lysophospholipase